MQVLLDTHFLIWVSMQPWKLSKAAVDIIEDPSNDLFFSVASIWEVAIKHARGRADFTVAPGVLRRRLLENGYLELPVVGAHVLVLPALPPLHHDPFDRILVAQASTEGLVLLTVDPIVARYPVTHRFMKAARNGKSKP